MVALVTNGVDDKPIAIHRTFLARDGNGKAPVDPAKMMLGPCHGGVVRLAEPRRVLMIGEGIETCLAAMQAAGHAAWSALSTSGLRALDLPRAARDVIVLADGDEPGEEAAQDCARRWKREGRRVRIACPPHGMDFNDLLNACFHRRERPIHQSRSPVAEVIDAAEDIRGSLEGLAKRTTADPGAPFMPDALEALAAMKKDDRAAFEALRAQLKKAGCRVTELDVAIVFGSGSEKYVIRHPPDGQAP